MYPTSCGYINESNSLWLWIEDKRSIRQNSQYPSSFTFIISHCLHPYLSIHHIQKPLTMQYKAVFFTALISSTMAANYNIKLYEHQRCLVKVGKQCSNIADGVCCNDGGKQYRSGKFEEVGSDKTSDNLKLYAEQDCGGLDLVQKKGGKCATAKDKNVQGAKIFIVIDPQGKRELPERQPTTQSPRSVTPDTVFMEEGNVRYLLARNTTEGEAFERLRSVDEQVAHMKAYGVRDETFKA
ncbi:hypothetical protein F4778DRAFT_719064 [Xylariomycetidae sp. FL2044]|nr:hypothetical protein F4778DRAFT_719064 [Xylariomycetidae sp. FL2044]